MIKASVALALTEQGNSLKYAGKGYQLEASFNRGDEIGEYIPFSNNEKGIEVKTASGRTVQVKHGDYYDE